jgi:hypothetical protein
MYLHLFPEVREKLVRTSDMLALAREGREECGTITEVLPHLSHCEDHREEPETAGLAQHSARWCVSPTRSVRWGHDAWPMHWGGAGHA